MADNKPQTVTLTNNDAGPRFLYSLAGQVVVQPGQSLTTDMNQAQLDAAGDEMVGDTEVPRWTIEKADADDAGQTGDADLSKLSVTKLRELAEAEGVALTGRKDAADQPLPDLKSRDDIAAAIVAKRTAA